MPNIQTYFKILDLLELNNEDGLLTSDFTSRAGISYSSAKQILGMLLVQGKVELRGRKWKLKKINTKTVQSGL